jgi:ATP-binding cassette, subfamily B, heavy metal transporter
VHSLALHNLNAAIQGTVLSIGLVILGGREIEAGTMTVGDLALLNTYFLRLARPRMPRAGRQGRAPNSRPSQPKVQRMAAIQRLRQEVVVGSSGPVPPRPGPVGGIDSP